MSPEEVCPECGKLRLFHEDEMEGVREGTVVCTKCSLEHEYYVFLGEVLDGEHPQLIDELRQRLEDER